jgi:C1A family cysteine protease
MSDSLIIEKDMRKFLPGIRDQGQRPLCLAFAASDFNSAHNQLSYELSVEFLAHHAYAKEEHANYLEGLTTKSIIEVLSERGQPSEKQLPYDRFASDPALPKNEIEPRYCVDAVNKSSDVINSVNVRLEEGEVIVACISLPRTFQTISTPYILDNEVGNIGYHAVLIVGSAKKKCGSKFFLIRNSWGAGWGDNGHCWLSEEFLRSRTLSLLEVVK